MSSLNSHSLTDIIRLVTFGGKIPTSVLHSTGVDIEVLEEVFKAVKPELNFFDKHRFSAIKASFQGWHKDNTPWSEWLKALPNPDRFKQVIMLAYVEIVDLHGFPVRVTPTSPRGASDYSYACLRIYLTKSGEWIVWTNQPISRFEVVKSARKAIKIAYGMLGDGQCFSAKREAQDAWPKPRPIPRIEGKDFNRVSLASLAMEMAAELLVVYGSYADKRDERAQSTRSNHNRYNNLVDGIDL